MPGFVLCSTKRLVHNVSQFEAQIRILDLKSILTAGFNCVLHVHAAIEEVTFAALLHKLQKGTNRKSKLPPSRPKTNSPAHCSISPRSRPRRPLLRRPTTTTRPSRA